MMLETPFISLAASILSVVGALLAVTMTIFLKRARARSADKMRQVEVELRVPLLERISGAINDSHRRVYITEYSIPMFATLYPRLFDAASRGVLIRIIVPQISNEEFSRRSRQTQEELKYGLNKLVELNRNGLIEVRSFRYSAGAPLIIIDDAVMIFPYIYNLSEQLNTTLRTLPLIELKDSSACIQVLEAFESIWSTSEDLGFAKEMIE